MKQVLNKKATLLIIHIYNNQLTNYVLNEIAKKLEFKIHNVFKDSDAIVIDYKTKSIGATKSINLREYDSDEVMNIVSLSGIEPMIEYATISKVKHLEKREIHYVGGYYNQSQVAVDVTPGKIEVITCSGKPIEVKFEELTAIIRTSKLTIGPWKLNENDITKIGDKFVSYDQLKRIKEAYIRLQLK